MSLISEWQCQKCSRLVNSKCIWERQIFGNKEDISLRILSLSIYQKENTICIEIPKEEEEEEEKEQFLIQILEIIKENKGALNQCLCDHDYRIKNNDHLCSLGHKHD